MEGEKRNIILRDRLWKKTAIFLILIVTFISFLPCLSHEFLKTWDDGKHHLLTFLANGGKFAHDPDLLQFGRDRQGKGMLPSLAAFDG